MKKGIILKVRLILIVAWLFALGFFLFKTIAPNGSILYVTDFSKNHRFIGNITPVERVEDAELGKIVTGDPVYFSLYYPRHFEEAELTVKYKWLDDSEKVFSAGMLADNRLWQYYLQPMENTILEKLLNKWHVIENEGAYFLQRENNFNSLDEFLNSDLNRSELALYNLTSQEMGLADFVLPAEKRELAKPATINTLLRGHHQFFVYHFGEDLNINLKIQDLNQNKDYDPVDLVLYFQDQIILNSVLEDDGSNIDNGEASALRDLSLKASNLPEGLYKVEIKVNNDIVTKEIKSSSNFIAFINGIRLAPGSTDASIYTNQSYLRATTVNPGSLQTIRFNNTGFELEETYTQHYWSLEETKDWNKIELSQSGVMLANDGLFVFDKNLVFNPDITQLGTETNLDNINYIIAKYEPIEKIDDWNVAKANFELYRVFRQDNKYNFMLSIPGLSNQEGAGLVIDSLSIELKGKSLWQKIKEVIKE